MLGNSNDWAPAEPDPLPHLRFSLLDRHRYLVRHAVFTRHGGVSDAPFNTLNVSYSMGDRPESVAENRTRCARMIGIEPAQLVTAGLVHGTAVAAIDRVPEARQPDGSGIVPDVDILVTDQPGIGLMITAGDCLQVLLLDPARPAVAMAHAGWRGLAAGVLACAVQAMQHSYGSEPRLLLAGIGPGLGPCCAEFSDPARELPAPFQRYVDGQRHVDLWSAARDQLGAAGVPAAQIEHHAICTVCHRDDYFSHRGDRGRTGRFAAIIALRPAAAGTP